MRKGSAGRSGSPEIPREEIFITTKVWNSDQGYERTLAAFEASLQRLGMEYVDLYLIHWPVKGKYKETWRALETLYKEGKARAIGVSNFQVHHLEDLMADAEIKPMVNQVEFHPFLTQEKLRDFCRREGIQLEAWSPLMRGEVVNVPEIVELAEKYGKRRPRSCCAGISSTASSPSPNRCGKRESGKTPTCSISNCRRRTWRNWMH